MNIVVIIIISLVAAVVIYLFIAYRRLRNIPLEKDHEKIKTLTVQNFQSQIKSGITLVDFWADWCMPCKMMAPVLNNLAEELDGNESVAKVNIEQHQAIAAKYNIRSIPTLVLFKNGKEITRFSGIKTKDFLLKEIKKIQ